ncbi:hypothetical protein [uncultured Litoreibacter sp.]|uniref:hypothetical protein n=1 Tax=uncultured Litoreibacter sp. TaxID=1392394 RepID=UPI0026134DCB|nr:hypothetical protein [uncultured Litoreibacter sp.]
MMALNVWTITDIGWYQLYPESQLSLLGEATRRVGGSAGGKPKGAPTNHLTKTTTTTAA